jgi:hypothetical protein
LQLLTHRNNSDRLRSSPRSAAPRLS